VQDEAGEKTNHAARRIAAWVIVRLLAFVVALSFPATLLPLAKVSAASSTMACCVGKKESHCHASAKAKKAAEHEHSTDTSNPAFQTAVRNLCSDCCACSVSTQQQREKGKAQPVARTVAPAVVALNLGGRPIPFSSSHVWEQTSPRGPPSFLL
jgi:hypothetical protein